MKSIFSHMRKFTLAMAVISAAAVSAQDISYQQAVAIATDFFQQHGVSAAPAAMRRAKGAPAANNGNSPYYIINSDNAFAVVAGDSRVTPILAYSLDGEFDDENIADGAAYMLEMYEHYITELEAGEASVPTLNLPPLSQGKVLTTATWNQNPEPWWDKCPSKSGRQCVAGCVATAMSIIMRYHNWPTSTGYGSKSYTTRTHGFECSADFSATDYKISTLPITSAEIVGGSDEVKNNIATLLYHAGVAASMDYDPSGSGAFNMNSMIGICRYFGYNYGGMLDRSNCTSDDEYLQQIVAEIDADRPAMYSGQNYSGGGHMFVCDGYDTDYKLHFNFGWSGWNNGYYSILETSMEYYKAQCVILGVSPNYNAASATAPVLYFPESGDNYSPIEIRERQGQTVGINVNQIYNMSDDNAGTVRVVLKICDSNGNPKRDFMNFGDMNLKSGYSWTFWNYGTLPSDYTYVPGDRLYLFYSEDGGATYQVVERYQKENYLDLALLYDTTLSDLKMLNSGGICPGLEVTSGAVLTDGTPFTVNLGNLYDYTNVNFDGQIAIYLCDSQDNPKGVVGGPSTFSILSNLVYSDVSVSCSIGSEFTVEPGDRLVAFCRPTGRDNWTIIPCDDPTKYYITIPDMTIPRETITFSGMFAPFSSENNLDFTDIRDFGAYTVTMQDSETLLLNRIDQVPNGVGVLLMGSRGSRDYVGVAPVLDTPVSAPAENLLIAVTNATAVDNTAGASGVNYVFKTSPDIGFYFAEGETVPAGTAYLHINGSALGAPMKFIFMGGGQNGVMSVIADPEADTTIYNLQGIKVTNPGPGIYIIGGKKVIIR